MLRAQASSLAATHLQRLVFPAQLLHSRRRVVQLPLQLQHFALKLLYFPFAFNTPGVRDSESHSEHRELHFSVDILISMTCKSQP